MPGRESLQGGVPLARGCKCKAVRMDWARRVHIHSSNPSLDTILQSTPPDLSDYCSAYLFGCESDGSIKDMTEHTVIQTCFHIYIALVGGGHSLGESARILSCIY